MIHTDGISKENTLTTAGTLLLFITQYSKTFRKT